MRGTHTAGQGQCKVHTLLVKVSARYTHCCWSRSVQGTHTAAGQGQCKVHTLLVKVSARYTHYWSRSVRGPHTILVKVHTLLVKNSARYTLHTVLLLKQNTFF